MQKDPIFAPNKRQELKLSRGSLPSHPILAPNDPILINLDQGEEGAGRVPCGVYVALELEHGGGRRRGPRRRGGAGRSRREREEQEEAGYRGPPGSGHGEARRREERAKVDA